MSEYIQNSTQRKETLKRLIRELHAGVDVEQVKAEFAALLGEVGATEIAEIEQALIREGLPETEIKRLCDVHVAVFRESLDTQVSPETTPGHPIHTFRAENDAAAQVLDALTEALESGRIDLARERLTQLQEYDRHFLRKEHILFPYLERHGFSGPASVMWAIHDDVRADWKILGELLSREPQDGVVETTSQVMEVNRRLNTAIRDMFYKEDNILFPTALEMLSADEWSAIRNQETDIGYCYVQPARDQWPPEAETREKGQTGKKDGVLQLRTGELTLQEINLMLSHLPVDVTYVDEQDTVRFFSEGRDRIFPRSPAIIGRRVQQCHPPSSVDRVQQILDAFRAGQRDEAEFWIQIEGRFVSIRYYAIRDGEGAYRGTLEVTQDVTHLRQLKGERRLLDDRWGEE